MVSGYHLRTSTRSPNLPQEFESANENQSLLKKNSNLPEEFNSSKNKNKLSPISERNFGRTIVKIPHKQKEQENKNESNTFGNTLE